VRRARYAANVTMMEQTRFDNLLDVMVHTCSLGERAARQSFFRPSTGQFEPRSYAQILARSFGMGRRLRDDGLRPGALCLIVATDRELSLTIFYAAVSVGAR